MAMLVYQRVNQSNETKPTKPVVVHHVPCRRIASSSHHVAAQRSDPRLPDVEPVKPQKRNEKISWILEVS